MQTTYLVYVGEENNLPEAARSALGLRQLHDGLFACRSPKSRSRLYHDVKRHLKPGTPLLGRQIDEIPKFKSMLPGESAWFRANGD